MSLIYSTIIIDKMFSPPIIVNDVIKFLESKGHKCMIYNGLTGSFTWCCKDYCSSVKIRNDMDKRNDEAMNFAKELKDKGHNCIYYMESYPVQIGWCRQNICVNK